MSFNEVLEKKKLLQAENIIGSSFKLIKVNPLCEDDAKFIINLRNREFNNFLKESSSSLKDQLDYLQKYNTRYENGEEIYFKIFDIAQQIYNGVVRITELNNIDSFGWESMVVKEDITPVVPTDVMLAIYSIGFERLRRKSCGPWEVSKDNVRVLKWHEKLGMTKIVNEDAQYFYLSVKDESYFSQIEKYNKIGIGFANYIN